MVGKECALKGDGFTGLVWSERRSLTVSKIMNVIGYTKYGLWSKCFVGL